MDAGVSEQSWKSGHFNLFLEEKIDLTNVSEISSCEGTRSSQRQLPAGTQGS